MSAKSEDMKKRTNEGEERSAVCLIFLDLFVLLPLPLSTKLRSLIIKTHTFFRIFRYEVGENEAKERGSSTFCFFPSG
jgi:hypothetical protein